MIKEFAKKNKVVIGILFVIGFAIAGFTATPKDNAVLEDLKSMFDSLVVEEAVSKQPELKVIN